MDTAATAWWSGMWSGLLEVTGRRRFVVGRLV